jgi:uncharacterized protein
MTLLEITGFMGAGLIGVALGLIGGGGSILTVPVMVYMMGVNPVLSTAYSLFVVGVSALVGAIQNIRKGLVCYKTALFFAVPSFVTVYLTRRYLLPAIPETLFTWGTFTMSKSMGVMVFFGIIMLIAALPMIRPQLEGAMKEDRPVRFRHLLIILEGVGVGVLTGIVGAGGGFLIIPALVLLARLPMKLAIGTSLLIIAAKSLIGFVGDLGTGQPIDWLFLLIFTGLAVLGIFLGSKLSTYVAGYKLKKGFGWFVLVMGLFIIIQEIFLH